MTFFVLWGLHFYTAIIGDCKYNKEENKVMNTVQSPFYIRLVHLDVEVRPEEWLAPALLCHKEPARASKAPY